MADQQITDFTEDTSPATDDYVATVDVSDTTASPAGTNKKVTLQKIADMAGGGGGGGQTTVTKVVAASGGDYTTLTAALAAAADGWTIYVRPGTYSESNITCSLNNISIIGDNPAATVLDFAANSLSLAGNDIYVSGVKINFYSGHFYAEGQRHRYINNEFACAAIGSSYPFIGTAGNYFIFTGNTFTTSASSTGGYMYNLTSNNSRYINNYFASLATSSNTGINIGVSNSMGTIFSGNTIVGSGTGGTLVRVQSSAVQFSNNSISGNNPNLTAINSNVYGSHITNNKIYGVGRGIDIYSGESIVANNYIQVPYATSTGIRVYGNLIQVSNNLILGNNTAGNTGISINDGNTDNTITGNLIRTSATGILVGSTAARTIIDGNSLHNTGTPITDNGTGTVLGTNVV